MTRFVRRRLLLALVALSACRASGTLAEGEAGDPAARNVRAFYDALLSTMKDAQRLGLRGRYDRLAPVIQSTFDLPAMTRIAVGTTWTQIPAAEQSMLVDAFTRMTIATYASRFDGYSGERFEVSPQVDTRTTGRVVRTRLIPANGDPVVLDYLMRESRNDWKIVDVYLTGTISELATRRSEFAAILKSGGPSALIAQLKAQGDQLLEDKAPAK
jgi:phospholipid transport system substrate-binding protein